MDCWYYVGCNNNCNFKNKVMHERITILGGGVSGIGAAILAKKKGFNDIKFS